MSAIGGKTDMPFCTAFDPKRRSDNSLKRNEEVPDRKELDVKRAPIAGRPHVLEHYSPALLTVFISRTCCMTCSRL